MGERLPRRRKRPLRGNERTWADAVLLPVRAQPPGPHPGRFFAWGAFEIGVIVYGFRSAFPVWIRRSSRFSQAAQLKNLPGPL